VNFAHAADLPGRPNVASTAQAEPREQFEALFHANSRLILGYALRRLDRPEDAADVLSEVMLTAWRRRADIPAGDEATLWLYGVARRAVANWSRGDRRRTRLAEHVRAAVEHHTAADHADEHAAVDEVRVALRQLSDLDREVLLLSAWEGLDPVQISTVLDLTPATARSRLHRARGRLRAELEEPSTESTPSADPLATNASEKGRR
jgi:RNA polymerase sigma factor (sigma-70 family)